MHLPSPAGALARGVLGRRDGSQGCVTGAHGLEFHGNLLTKLAALIADKLARGTRPADPALAEPLPDGAGVLGRAGCDDLKPGRQIEAIDELMLLAPDIAEHKQVNSHTLTKLASTSELGGKVRGIDRLFESGTHGALMVEST